MTCITACWKAFITRSSATKSSARGAPKEIRLSGGILNSEYWTQMAADIFGAPMVCADIPHASLIGAAMMGAQALDVNADLFDAQAGKTVYPRPEMTARYAEKYARYIEAYERG